MSTVEITQMCILIVMIHIVGALVIVILWQARHRQYDAEWCGTLPPSPRPSLGVRFAVLSLIKLEFAAWVVGWIGLGFMWVSYDGPPKWALVVVGIGQSLLGVRLLRALYLVLGGGE